MKYFILYLAFCLALLVSLNQSLTKATQNDCQYFKIEAACRQLNK